MEWDDLKYFLAVARTGSLSDAGRKLKASPATVGRRVAALERSLGARLFDRAQSGYTLTENGEAVRRKAEEVEDSVLSVQREALGRDLSATGKVRIATAEDIASFVIAPTLREFRTLHPGIALELVAGWDVVNLTRREADVAIRTVRPPRGGFLIRKVGVWTCGVYVSKDYARARKLKPNQPEMPVVDVIDWTEESTFSGARWFRDNARGSTVVFSASSRHIQLAACRAGIGAAILPCVVADDDPSLVRLMSPERVRAIDLWIVVHRDLARTARVRAVLDFLGSRCFH